MFNPFISQKLAEKQGKVSKDTWEIMCHEGQILSKLGISSEEQQKKLFYVMFYGEPLIKQMMSNVDFESLAKISSYILSQENKYPIDTLRGFCKAAENAVNKLKLPMKKMAYPSGDTISIESPYNVQKWMSTMKEIYGYVQNGYDYNKAFDFVIRNWDIMEQNNFKRWMAFYQENAQNKYKVASYYQSGPGAMIPMDHLNAKVPDMSPFGPSDIQKQQTAEKLSKVEEVKKKIRAIVSRLNAAERLATDPDVQRDLQSCLDIGVPKWLEELQRVKRLIQLAPMRSAASPILEDLIVKQANILEHNGYPVAAFTMKKLAQEPAPGMTEEQNGETAIKELIEGMNFDTQEVEDIEKESLDDLANIIVTAEPEPLPPPVIPNPAELEVSEDAPLENDQKSVDLFEAALSNVTIPEVIAKLEGVANIFRTREISRQLAMIDLMMDKLGISSYFPSLAEANSKTLESNQYALTRIEDILSKLRGAVETPVAHQVDLNGPEKPVESVKNISPDAVKSNLADQAAAEKARKEQRKKEQEAPAPPTPAAPPPELTQPVNIQKPPTG